MTRFKTSAITPKHVGGPNKEAAAGVVAEAKKGMKITKKSGGKSKGKGILYMQKGKKFSGRGVLPGEREKVNKSIAERDALVKKNVDRKNMGTKADQYRSMSKSGRAAAKKKMTEKYTAENSRLNDSVADAHMKSKAKLAPKKKAGGKCCGGGKTKGLMYQTGGAAPGYTMKPNESVVSKTLEMERAGTPLTSAGLAQTQEQLKGTSLEGIQMSAATKLFRNPSNMPGRPKFNSMKYRGIFTPVEGSEKVYVDPRYRNANRTLDMIRQNNPGRNIEFIFGRAPQQPAEQAPRGQVAQTFQAGGTAPVGQRIGAVVGKAGEVGKKLNAKTNKALDKSKKKKNDSLASGKRGYLKNNMPKKKKTTEAPKGSPFPASSYMKGAKVGTKKQQGGPIVKQPKSAGPIKKVGDINNTPAFEAPGYATNAKNAKQAANAYSQGGRFYFNGQLF